MSTDKVLDKYLGEILVLSGKIYDLKELGSREVQSSITIMQFLENLGFTVHLPYMDMHTAFRAESGNGKFTVGFLAEYDALPNGHSCGHNLISAWAAGSAAVLKDMVQDVRIVVIGTPSEEGLGEYAGSKVRMVADGVFDDINIVFGMHPDDRWAAGSKALADLTLRLEFTGKSSHGADSPESSVNALDAAVTTYSAINSLRSWAKHDKHLVIGMIFREAGQATNVVPEKAILDVEIRSTSTEFVKKFSRKVIKLATGISDGYDVNLKTLEITPLYDSYKPNLTMDSIIEEEMRKLGLDPVNVNQLQDLPSGSTDEANVSYAAPTGHIDIKIGYPGIPGHSDEFREASKPEKASESLRLGIIATVNTVLRIHNDKLYDDIIEEFNRGELRNGNRI